MNPSRLQHQKSLMRKQLRDALRKISNSKRKQKSLRIIKKLVQTASFKRTKNLFIYVALPHEVQTRPLISIALRLNKKVFVPLVARKHKQLKFYEIRKLSKDLKRGAFGVWEPRKRKNRIGQPRKQDLIIVPGLGFDKKMGRLGRGMGYFDCFLMKTKSNETIGFAFREQMKKKIPMNRFDVRVNRVIVD